MARPLAFQAGEGGSEPPGVTAGVVERYHAAHKPEAPFQSDTHHEG